MMISVVAGRISRTALSVNRKVKGDMDVELAIDAMEMPRKLDRIVPFSGDGEFRRPVEAVQREGVRVSVVSTLRSHPPMVADELRRQASRPSQSESQAVGELETC